MTEDLKANRKSLKHLNDRVVELERMVQSSRLYLEDISHKLDKTGKVCQSIYILRVTVQVCRVLVINAQDFSQVILGPLYWPPSQWQKCHIFPSFRNSQLNVQQFQI